MGQPPPPPTASTDNIIPRKRRGNTGTDSPYAQNPTVLSRITGPYAQGQSEYGALHHERNLTAHAEFSSHSPPSQDLVFFTYPRKSHTAAEFHGSMSGETSNSAFSRYTPETSPPARSQIVDVITSHKGQSVLKTPTPARCRTTRDRRAEKKNRESRRRDPTSSIGKPLSAIALEVPDVFVPDAAAFATRPVDVRRKEATDAGKIKRPLNAFMLYRKSYQNVAKTRCARNNHQQVSTVCGDSWTSCEPPDIVSEFNRLAGIEKQMHEQAFPDYKYDPVLTKKPGDDGDASIFTSDTSDPEYINRRTGTKRNARKREVRNAARLSEPLQVPQYEEYSEIVEMAPSWHSVPTTGPYWSSPVLRPLPTPYDEEHPTYVNQIYRGQVIGSMGDPIISRSPSPITNCLDRGLVVDPDLCFVDTSIDPSLLPESTIMSYDGILHGLPMEIQEEWYQQPAGRQDIGVMMPDLDANESFDAYLRGNEQDWKIEQLDEVSQFNDWMSQTVESGM